jgi:hypothetical protein
MRVVETVETLRNDLNIQSFLRVRLGNPHRRFCPVATQRGAQAFTARPTVLRSQSLPPDVIGSCALSKPRALRSLASPRSSRRSKIST